MHTKRFLKQESIPGDAYWACRNKAEQWTGIYEADYGQTPVKTLPSLAVGNKHWSGKLSKILQKYVEMNDLYEICVIADVLAKLQAGNKKNSEYLWIII